MTENQKENLQNFTIKNEEAFIDDLKSGKHFNLFRELNIETKEIKHSLFLASLLNPNGLHGLGMKPLERFIEIAKSKLSFSSQKEIKTFTEYSIPNGTIDILIRSNENLLIIENKIYHHLTEGQMAKYYAYAEKEGRNFEVFLLTLKDDITQQELNAALVDPKDEKRKIDQEQIKKITYEEEIKSLLEDLIRDEGVNGDYLTMYKDVLERLTGEVHEFKSKLLKKYKLESEDVVRYRDELRLKFMEDVHQRLKNQNYKTAVVERVNFKKSSLKKVLTPLRVKPNVGLQFELNDESSFTFEIQDYSRLIYGIHGDKTEAQRDFLENNGYLHENLWHLKEYKIYTRQNLTFPFYDDRLNYTLQKDSPKIAERLADKLIQELEIVRNGLSE
jgi:hypothetical protein